MARILHSLLGELEVFCPRRDQRFDAGVGLAEGHEGREGGNGVGWEMVRLKTVLPEEACAEGAQRQPKPSVKMCGEDDVLVFFWVRLYLSFRRNPRLHPIGDSPASAEPVYIRLRNVGAFPGAPRTSFLTLLAFLASLFLFLGLSLVILQFSVANFLAEVGRGSVFRCHWFGAKGL